MPETPPQTDTYNTALDIFDRTHPLRVDTDENLKVNIAAGTIVVTPSGTQDVNIVSSVPIPAAQSGSWTVSLTSGSIEIGTVDQGTPATAANAWPVYETVSGVAIDPRQIRLLTASDTVTTLQGTSPWVVSGTVTANLGTVDGLALNTTLTNGTQRTLVDNFPAVQSVSQSGTWTTGRTWALLNTTDSVNVGNFPATQPVSGTVTANQGTSPWVTSVSNFPATQPISAVSLPLPTGASTAALQTQPGVDIGDVTVNNAVGAAAVNIQDGGNSITVDGTVSTSQITSSTATLSNVAGSASSVTLLSSNASRKMAAFFNDSTSTLSLKMGATASATSFTVNLVTNAYYELPAPVYTGRIDGIWALATGSVRITEFT